MFHILSLDPLHHLHTTTLQITLWLSKLTCCSDNTSLSWDLNYTYWSSGNFLVHCADYIKQNKIKCMIFNKTDFITWTMDMAIKKITLVVSWMLVLWSVRTTTMKRSRVDQDLGMVQGLGLVTMSTLGAQQRRRQPPQPPPPLPPPPLPLPPPPQQQLRLRLQQQQQRLPQQVHQ